MKLGILVNSDRHLEHVIGLTKAATGRHHEVMIFVMDEGTRLLQDEAFVDLVSEPSVRMSFCDHSAGNFGIKTEGLSDSIICGSQLNNSMMNHEADRVIVL